MSDKKIEQAMNSLFIRLHPKCKTCNPLSEVYNNNYTIMIRSLLATCYEHNVPKIDKDVKVIMSYYRGLDQ